MVKAGPPVIFAGPGYLGTEVTALHTRTDSPRLHVPDLHQERLHAVVVLVDEEACEDDRVAREQAQVARPVFSCCDARRIDDKLIFVPIKGGCSLEPCNVRAMAQLGLCIAPNDVNVVN